jgi:methylmalonyl-CoA/ethylmalonyl-CoA epimerase
VNDLNGDFKLTHIGWAVNSAEDAAKSLEALGFKKKDREIDDEGRAVRILLMENADGEVVELVAPLGGKTPVSNFLLRTGPAPYHCCFATSGEKIAETLSTLKEAGFKELIKASPAPALENDDVIFLYSKEIGVVELRLKPS